jgi:radical SAM protein with 4Fe4S-binding SPASM domain
LEEIESTLKFFLARERNAPSTRIIMFMGGGEPTLSWHLVELGTAIAEKIASENGIRLKKQLSTNGSILTPKMLDFYKKHQFELQFSFDVLPDIQNKQRGMFDKVSANLQLLGEQGVKCRIRSTITELNIDRMVEMVEFCHKQYSNVRHLTCEHVVDPVYFSSLEVVREFYEKYFQSFIEAQELAKKYDIDLFSTSQGTIRALRDRFCFNLYCITPYGTITTCPNVSSPQEQGYNEAVFGKVDGESIIFDNEAYEAITYGSIETYVECNVCWARWNCGGGCPNQRRVYKPDIFSELCNHTRRMLRHNLINELAEKHRNATNRDLFVEISKTLRSNKI